MFLADLFNFIMMAIMGYLGAWALYASFLFLYGAIFHPLIGALIHGIIKIRNWWRGG